MIGKKFHLWKGVLALVAAGALLIQLYLSLYYAPTEKYMGEVQRIMYFHVPAAFVAFAAFTIVFVSGLFYLFSSKRKWDHLAASAAEIGVVFTTIVLITGALWARPVWNAWWVWEDPRLVTSLILWFMYIAYLLIRHSIGEERKMRKFASIFGIIGFINVPFVYYSVKWWRTIHPKVIDEQGVHMPPEMANTLFYSIGVFLFFFFILLLYRYEQEIQGQQAIDFKKRLFERLEG